MNSLHKKKTDSTLEIDFDPDTAVLAMRGESYPENAGAFFAPLIQWLEEFFVTLEVGAEVRVDLDIIYFNSSSSKALMNCFDILDQAACDGARVSILWRHHEDNEVARECGEEFSEELQCAAFDMQAYGDGR